MISYFQSHQLYGYFKTCIDKNQLLLSLPFPLVILSQHTPGCWGHEPLWWQLPCLGQPAHPGPGDKVKICFPSWVKEIHPLGLRIVSCNSERYDLQLGHPGGHGEHLPPVHGAVQVHLGVRVGQPCWVSPNYVKVCSGRHSGLSVPLHLGGASVHHGGGEDGEHRAGGVQHTSGEDSLVLGHADREGDIIILGPASQWVE